MSKQKKQDTFVVPAHIQELFRGAEVARHLTHSYAKVDAELSARAWEAFESLHPQIPGCYYVYNGEIMRREKRPPPKDLVQK